MEPLPSDLNFKSQHIRQKSKQNGAAEFLKVFPPQSLIDERLNKKSILEDSNTLMEPSNVNQRLNIPPPYLKRLYSG